MLLKKNIPFRYIFGKIRYELLVILLYTTLIAVLHETNRVLPISIPLTIPALLGTIISLLLGFRSNQAYDRWWEARHIWGAIVNESRTLARQILTFTDITEEGDDVHLFRERMIRRQIGWCFSLGQSLRDTPAIAGLDGYLHRKELESVSHYDNVPSALLDQHGRDLKRALENGWINRYQQVELDRTVTRLCDAMGKCERIKNTVFPSTYSMYIHFSLLLFITLLPFGVIEYFGFLEIPLVMAVSASFLLIEKMAIHLQDPFENKPTDTPMTAIARNIEKNLRQMLRDQEMPEYEKAEHIFYVL
jgi:putative membrane protein